MCGGVSKYRVCDSEIKHRVCEGESENHTVRVQSTQGGENRDVNRRQIRAAFHSEI